MYYLEIYQNIKHGLFLIIELLWSINTSRMLTDIRGLRNPEIIYLGGCRFNEKYDNAFWIEIDLTFRL